MTQKTALVAVLLILVVAAGASAVQVQIMVGLWLLFPTIEITVLTPPGAMGAFQQEIGFRFSSWLIFNDLDLVLRSWWSFPDSRSEIIRERFRCGIEYSPVLWTVLSDGGFSRLHALGLKPGFCSSFRANDPSVVTTTDLFLSLTGFVGKIDLDIPFIFPPIGPSMGVAFRSLDL